MTIAQQAVGVLRGPLAHRIRFSYTGLAGIRITVDSSSFERVAQAIELGQIHVLEGGAAEGSLVGAYAFRTNEFFLQPYSTSPNWGATVVHESVHASLDLTHSRISEPDNEAAAFLTSAMYLRLAGMPAGSWRRNAYNERFVRGTATRALRDGRVVGPGIQNLRLELVQEGYNGGEMGTDVTPEFFEGNG
jgi:hypothetical protein